MREKYSMVDHYMINKKIKETISIKKIEDAKLSIDTDNQILDDATVAILVKCVIKNIGKFYPQVFL